MDFPPYKGDLSSYSLSAMLISLSRQGVTGTLTIKTPDFTKRIYIKNGSVIFAASSLDQDRLGMFLLRSGRINAGQYDRSVELLHKMPGKRHGTLLVEQGFMKPEDLIWGVKQQVLEIIYSLFQPASAQYEFEEDFLLSNEVITLEMNTGTLIYEGISRVVISTGLDELPEPDAIFYLNEDVRNIFSHTEMRSNDAVVLSCIDGKRTARQVAEESYLDFPEVQKAYHVLQLCGLIARRGEQEINKKPFDEKRAGTVSKEELELRERADDLFKRLKSITEAELLQIDSSSDLGTVRRKYHMLAKEFHPDKVYNSDDKELKDKLTVIFNALVSAYNKLRDDKKRQEYFSSLGRISVQRGDAGKPLVREQLSAGIAEFRKGNYTGAAEIFKWLTNEEPANPKYWSYLSHALSRMPRRLKDAETAILQAVRLEPLNSEHLADLGLIYLKAGIKKRAKAQLERALQLDPENEKARKGLKEADKAE